jgi:hypothetical protein
MWVDVAVFGSMVGIFAVFHHIEKHHPQLQSKHRLVHGATLVMAHPAVHDGLKEFIIHVVVYSGHVFPK